MKLTLSSLLLTLCLLTCTANSVEVTTGNILNNSTFGTGTQYSETGWDVTGYDNHHDDLGSGTINNAPGGSFAAGVDSEISQSVTLSTDAEMNQKEIQNGFSSTLGADIWFWNNYNNTITLEQKITGSDGSVTTQTRIIPTANCGFSNCNQYNNYTDTHIQGSNTQTDFDIEVTVKNQGTGYTSGHLGPDIDDVTLSVTYTDIDLIDEDAQEAIDDIDENIPDIEDDFTWEEEFTFEDDYFTWEEDFNMDWENEYIVGDWEMDYEMEFNEDMYFEEEFVEMEMPEEFEEFDMTMMPEEEFVEMYFEEEFDEGAFMEMPEEFEEMEIEEEFTEMEMEEEFEEMEVMEEEPTEMEVVEEEETIDMETETEEDVVEMEAEEEEMEVAENDDSIQEPKEDEESSEGNEEALEEESGSEKSVSETASNEEESVEETDVADKGGITTKNIEVSKEIKIKNVDVGEIKISIDPRDIFKEVVNLDSYSNKDFYQDKGLQYEVNDDFFDQLSMIEYSKEIYKGITLVTYIQGDPIEIYKRELEELAIQKAGIMIELKLLRGE